MEKPESQFVPEEQREKNDETHRQELTKERKRRSLYSTGTDRPFEKYQELLGVPIEELRGKIILDIGPGLRQKFAKQATKDGVKVVSLNPELGLRTYTRELIKPSFLEKLQERPGSCKKESVAGIAQELPFKSEVFDAITALYSVPGYLPRDESETRKTFMEITRVLKPGGKAYIFPTSELFIPLDDERFRQGLLKIVEELKRSGYSIEFTTPVEGSDKQRLVIEKPISSEEF